MKFNPLPLFIGFRYLRGRSGDQFGRFVSYMSTAGITIGVMALITVVSVMNGFEGQLKERILGVLPHAYVAGEKDNPVDTDTVRQWPGVSSVAPIRTADTVIQSAQNLSAGILQGIDPNAPEPIANHMLTGSVSLLEPKGYRVIIGRQMARQLDVVVGDKVRLFVTNASIYTPVGRMPSYRNFTVVGVFDTRTDVDGQIMYANIRDVSALLRLKKSTPPDLRIFADDPFDVPSLKKFAVADGWQWTDWRRLRGELFQAVKMEKNMMGLMLSLIVLVAAFNIISALIMVVMEKQPEVAILKTQGMSRTSIIATFMVQGASSGIAGAVLGGGLGILLAMNLNAIMTLFNLSLLGAGMGLPVIVEYEQVITIILAAVGLSLLATLFPSITAASVRPAEALRYE
ncbi:lipoprotein-releasing ABC transporter permease subunit LolC [Veronia pacifica]|uniref:Transporter n=1 Tax=Veronia pacifica TaxID=1080227 RepID=A0A1C3EG54_9GAMM|nr:lipoprotein-releasing ABC transporter permease subunit LolC [Veronia pacifica]ODA32210.1 transporter [Veronia pacifica]